MKYKGPLQQPFKFHAFHPKAVNLSNVSGRSSGLLTADNLPEKHFAIQWYEEPAGLLPSDLHFKQKNIKYQSTKLAYSYGDSAGITPDFPFNSAFKRKPNTLQI